MSDDPRFHEDGSFVVFAAHQVDRLVKANRANRIVMAVLALVVLVIGYLGWQQHESDVRLQHDAVAACQAGNVQRQNERRVWDSFVNILLRGDSSPQDHAEGRKFKAFVAQVDAPRNCTLAYSVSAPAFPGAAPSRTGHAPLHRSRPAVAAKPRSGPESRRGASVPSSPPEPASGAHSAVQGPSEGRESPATPPSRTASPVRPVVIPPVPVKSPVKSLVGGTVKTVHGAVGGVSRTVHGTARNAAGTLQGVMGILGGK